MGENLTADQEKRVKRLKRVVEGWRVVVLQMKSVMLWEQPWYPVLIVGLLSFTYFLLWLLEPNSLTLLASIGILINLLDLVVPLVSAQLVSPSAWTGAHERQLDEMCRSIILAVVSVEANVASFYKLRFTKPLVYYSISIVVLFMLLWVGKSVNNGRLLYITVTALSLTPGALRYGLPCKLQAALRGVPTKKEN